MKGLAAGLMQVGRVEQWFPPVQTRTMVRMGCSDLRIVMEGTKYRNETSKQEADIWVSQNVSISDVSDQKHHESFKTYVAFALVMATN